MGEGQQEGEGAGLRPLPTPQQVAQAELARAARIRRAEAEHVAALGSGGFINRRSSPVLFWLADRLQEQGIG